MKVKIINSDSADFENIFKVRRLNFDQVVVTYPGSEGIKVFENNEVEFITESPVDEFLIEHKDFLKIKLDRGISVALYKVLLEILEEDLKEKVENLEVLKDKNTINTRGIWEKEMLCAVNNIPYKVVANGHKFKKKGFEISLNRIGKEEFLEICTFDIKKITKEIKEREKKLQVYGKAINLMDTSVSDNKLLK